MLWIILFVLCLKEIHAGYKGATITCVCSTVQCSENHEKHCNTTGMCFTQYLDRQDGSHPVVRGCISSKTPLLCENRKPAIATGAWPVLLCCKSNLCNRDVVPTAPPWLSKEDVKNDTMLSSDQHVIDAAEMSAANNDLTILNQPNLTSTLLSSHSGSPSSFRIPFNPRSSSSSFPHIISPVYISVLVLGAISLVVIGIVAAVVLKRGNHFFAEQYGALEQQQEQAYLKHGRLVYPPPLHPQGEFDSDEESLSQCSQFYIHVIEPSQQCNNT